jgi:hypothetical protein
MPNRATLVRLGKLVATDVVTGQPGANAQAAAQFVELYPDTVLDLVEMLIAEGRKKRPNDGLVSAYVYMIGQALEFTRYAIEGGRAQATQLADAVRQKVLGLGRSRQIEPGLILLILREFAIAKLDPGTELKTLMGSLMEQAASSTPGAESLAGIETHLADLAKEVCGDPFVFHAQMLEMEEALPEDHRAAMGAWLLGCDEVTAREAGIGWLLDSSASVRNSAASSIEQAASSGLVSGMTLRRLITLPQLAAGNRSPIAGSNDTGVPPQGCGLCCLAAAPGPRGSCIRHRRSGGAEHLRHRPRRPPECGRLLAAQTRHRRSRRMGTARAVALGSRRFAG